MSSTELSIIEALIREGRSDDARSKLREIVTKDPTNVMAWYLYSQVATGSEARRAALKKVLALDPIHVQAHEDLAVLETEKSSPNLARLYVPLSLIAGAILLLVIGLLFTRLKQPSPAASTSAIAQSPNETALPPGESHDTGPVALKDGSGIASLSFTGVGAGNQTLNGKASLTFDKNLLRIEITLPQGPDPVILQFYAPDFRVGKFYTGTSVKPTRDGEDPWVISSIVGCPGPGTFTVNRQQPSLDIDFTASCPYMAKAISHLVYTPQEAITPTATIAPDKLFVPDSTFGLAHADLYSAASDPVGNGRREFTLDGPGNMRPNAIGGVTFYVIPGDAPDLLWTFTFNPTDQFVLGESYPVTASAQTRTKPSLQVSSPVPANCGQLVGSFQVTSIQPGITITFSQVCNNDPAQELRGTLTFTPSSALPPTATLAPGNRFKLNEGLGEIQFTGTSDPGDLAGGGQGALSFRGTGRFRFVQGVLTFTLNRDNNPSDPWSFEFFSPRLALGEKNAPAIGVGQLGPVDILVVPELQVHGLQPCSAVKGEFTLVSSSNNGAEIDFTQYCNRDQTKALRGKMIFVPQSMLTATPTIPPDQLIQKGESTGVLRMELKSGANDPFDVGQSAVKLNAVAHVTTKPGVIDILAIPVESNHRSWNFRFFGPALAVGIPYDHAAGAPNIQTQPDSSFASIGITHQQSPYYCQIPSGSFTIKQQSPTLVITFAMSCDQSNQGISGTLTYTPDQTTATAVPAENLFTLSADRNGQITVDATSDPDDGIGHGKPVNLVAKGVMQMGIVNSQPVQALMISTDSPRGFDWQFMFSAPTLAVGVTYDDADPYTLGSTLVPGLQITNFVGASACTNSGGSFTIKQQAPTLIIDFTFHCDRNSSATFQGTLTYIPHSQVTPTPTLDPALRAPLTASPVEGKLTVDIQTGSMGNVAPTNTHLTGSWEGQYRLSHSNELDTLSIQSKDGQGWGFTLTAPLALQIGKAYLISPNNSVFAGIGYRNAVCNKVDGTATVIQSVPTVIIKIDLYCDNQRDYSMFGTLTFSPTP